MFGRKKNIKENVLAITPERVLLTANVSTNEAVL